MRKALALILILTFSSVYGQTPRSRSRAGRLPAHRPLPGRAQEARLATPAPIFLARQEGASINEMMLQPPAFSYGSSINIWLMTDKDKQIREISVTGHGDSPTCRRVSGMVMSTFFEKYREPDDLFVAGAAHLVNRGDPTRREALEDDPDVKAYIDAEKRASVANILVKIYSQSAGTGTGEQSALANARSNLDKINHLLDELKDKSAVQDYLKESRNAVSLSQFAGEVTEFSRSSGLVVIHEVPHHLVEEAKGRVAAAAQSKSATVVAFDDLLAKSNTSEAALITPVLTVPGGRPLTMHIPLARLSVSSFADARRSNRNEVENAIIGNAKQRIEVYRKSRKLYEEQLDDCKRLPREKLSEIVKLRQITTPEGVVYISEEPERMTREDYCKVKIPLNIKIIDEWIANTENLQKTVDEDAKRKEGSRIQDFNDATLIDSMLRDWRLPVARSQAAFDTWRKAARGPVWTLLSQQLQQMGIQSEVIGGEQMIFQVQIKGDELFISPLHVIDMARSVVVVNPAAGATQVLDAWSQRSTETVAKSENAQFGQSVHDLVRGTFARLAAGDQHGAHEQIKAAFSIDPGSAFRELEHEWLELFPNTQNRVANLQRDVQPVVEAAEWREAYSGLMDDPTYKENFREFIAAYRDLLDSYPKASVDLHLRFAFLLATKIAAIQARRDNRSNDLISPSLPNAWNVIEAYSQPLPSVPILRKLKRNGAPNSSNSVFTEVQRKQLETVLQKDGFQGQRLTQMMAVLEKIKTSNRDRYLSGRSEVSFDILADPASLILKAVQIVKERDPEYWARATQARSIPTEPSGEWLASDRATARDLTLSEAFALSLMRLQDGLRKSYWGGQAARYLWSRTRPDLKALLAAIDIAIGDGRTGSSSAYIGPQSTVKLFLNQNRIMDTLTREENAASLQSGSEALLVIVRNRMSRSESLLPFREHIPLRSRLWFESGDYMKAFEGLFVDEIPIALYHPDIRWQILPGDAVRKPLSVKARREGERMIFAAEFEEGKPVDVLALSGLPDKDSDSLLKTFNEIKEPGWSEFGKVSDQILLTPLSLRSSLQSARALLQADDVRLRVFKSMIYGRIAPGEDYLRIAAGTPALEQVVTTLDQVKGDQGIRYKVPSLAEVKQIAAAKIARKN